MQPTLVYRAASNMENVSKGFVCVIIIITSMDMNVHVSPLAYFFLCYGLRIMEQDVDIGLSIFFFTLSPFRYQKYNTKRSPYFLVGAFSFDACSNLFFVMVEPGAYISRITLCSSHFYTQHTR